MFILYLRYQRPSITIRYAQEGQLSLINLCFTSNLLLLCHKNYFLNDSGVVFVFCTSLVGVVSLNPTYAVPCIPNSDLFNGTRADVNKLWSLIFRFLPFENLSLFPSFFRWNLHSHSCTSHSTHQRRSWTLSRWVSVEWQHPTTTTTTAATTITTLTSIHQLAQINLWQCLPSTNKKKLTICNVPFIQPFAKIHFEKSGIEFDAKFTCWAGPMKTCVSVK